MAVFVFVPSLECCGYLVFKLLQLIRRSILALHSSHSECASVWLSSKVFLYDSAFRACGVFSDNLGPRGEDRHQEVT